jgi:alkylation response protein AidB-like acyl-CoA dehydrogenase
MQELRLNPVCYGPGRSGYHEPVRRFVVQEIAPQVREWDDDESVPRERYRRTAKVGLLGLGFPDGYGGVAVAVAFHRLLAGVELAHCASGGVVASLQSHAIGAPPVFTRGSKELKARAACDTARRADCRTRDHRAIGRLGHCRAAHDRRSPRRALRGRRREDSHCLRNARRPPLGGTGRRRGLHAERLHCEVRVNMIGGGAAEIMKDLAARQLGL